MAQSGHTSGGDLFDVAQEGTKVPEDAAQPRLIPSKPRADQIASGSDPNYIGGTKFSRGRHQCWRYSETMTPANAEVLTGTGDVLPSQVDSKRLHAVPGGVTHDPDAKGSTRYTGHIKQPSDVVKEQSDGSAIGKAPGDKRLSDEQGKDQLERKI